MNEAATIIKDAPIDENWWRPDNELKGLSAPLVEKLHAAGMRTADDLRKAGPKKLLALDGVGKVALEEIKVWLCSLD